MSYIIRSSKSPGMWMGSFAGFGRAWTHHLEDAERFEERAVAEGVAKDWANDGATVERKRMGFIEEAKAVLAKHDATK